MFHEEQQNIFKITPISCRTSKTIKKSSVTYTFIQNDYSKFMKIVDFDSQDIRKLCYKAALDYMAGIAACPK